MSSKNKRFEQWLSGMLKNLRLGSQLMPYWDKKLICTPIILIFTNPIDDVTQFKG
jgi:hypothetical protein